MDQRRQDLVIHRYYRVDRVELHYMGHHRQDLVIYRYYIVDRVELHYMGQRRQGRVTLHGSPSTGSCYI